MPLRAVLLVLALVPSAAMIGLVTLNSGQLFNNWRATGQHNTAMVKFASPVLTVFGSLQAERQLSAAALADPAGYGAKLTQQRQATDKAVATLQAPTGSAQAELASGIKQITEGLQHLADYRSAVDHRTATQQQTYDDYTGLIAADLELFDNSSDVGLADLNYRVRPVVDSVWGIEMLSREDAVLTPGIVGGRLSRAERTQLDQLSGAEQFIYDDKVVPLLPVAIGDQYRNLFAGQAWQLRTQVEQTVLNTPQAADGTTLLPAATGKQWQQSVAAITPQLQSLNQVFGATITNDTNVEVHKMAVNLIVNSVVGAVGVILVVVLTLVLTGVLRRRIFALRSAALDLQDRLPIVVERLRRGETVDTDAELPAIRYGSDELGMLGRALNAARSSALETTVRQVEQYRGFERLLQRIARRTQLLIGLQMKRLSEMERRHEDPDVLEGLFDLDHLTARLRRYEENLVILGGGQPQRRWRKPVPLLDLLRSAQGEVQDYRRIRIEAESHVWLSERAVGAVVHILAELMENAVAFSKPPTPVEVTASRVMRGLAIEIEDRGMGMNAVQYDEANTLMAAPPRMDVVSQADDARLGLYVVARLAAGLGIGVELRPSSFGGTRVVVLVPADLVVATEQESGGEPEDVSDFGPQLSLVDASLPVSADHFERIDGPAIPHQRVDWSELAAPAPSPEPASASAPTLVDVVSDEPEPTAVSQLDPLPRRVRQASLVTELREPRRENGTRQYQPEHDTPARRHEPTRSGASIGAFQRQSRLARMPADNEHPPTHPAPDRAPAPEED
ncbi:sensor histidine kinase [Catenulispora rubra]|uniref:sensor histidine kinase n=1 Tax=Catenulispora rubra TaxID=280293 RepID=UPI00189252AD|nr:nitrate- and nitrite sensing domain-containing protein [Catenulispora rubra]